MIIDKNKYKKRIVDQNIEELLTIAGAICIEGPKWCGKTWSSSYHSKSEFLIGSPENNFSNRKLAELNPSIILKGDSPRMIDEWQEVPSIWDATRYEVDKRGLNGQFILTGSSTPKSKGILHSGAGRIIRLKMNTMSLYEAGNSSGKQSLKDLCNGIVNEELVEETNIEDLAYYIIRGGWPQNINVNKEKAHIMPRSYIDNILNYDLDKLDNDTNYDKHKVNLLLKSLARNESTTCNISTLVKDISFNENDEVGRNTISKYLELLNRLFITNNQLPYSPSIRSSLRVKQNEKRHFFDPAIACALLNLNIEKLLKDLNTFGFLFEALVEHDLEIYANSFGAKLYHYQDYNNNEIDSIIELENGDYCAFEIKLGENGVEEGSKNLNRIVKYMKENNIKPPLIKCVIVGLGNAIYKRKDDVIVVPITSLKN